MLRITRGTSVDARDADDLVAETYARAWQHWPTLAAIERPEAWLSTVAWRLASTDWRNGRRRQDLLRRWAPATPALTGSAETGDPILDRIDLAAAMKALPDAQRQALHAHYWSGQPVAAIAERLGVRTGLDSEMEEIRQNVSPEAVLDEIEAANGKAERA